MDDFRDQLKNLHTELEVRGLSLQMSTGFAGGSLDCLISEIEGDVCVHAVIFRDQNDNPDIFVRSFSSGAAAYIVPLIEKIGDASYAINAARFVRERQ